jgi:hypothetical protein
MKARIDRDTISPIEAAMGVAKLSGFKEIDFNDVEIAL